MYRRNKIQFSESDLDETLATYDLSNGAVTRARKRRKISFIAKTIIFVTVVGAMYYAYTHLPSLALIQYEEKKPIVKREIFLDKYIGPGVQNKVYQTWEEYSQSWHPCLRLTGIEKDTNPWRWFAGPIPASNDTFFKYLFDVIKLEMSQLSHSSASKIPRIGNFTMPTMYLDPNTEILGRKSIFPCVCTLIMDGSPTSLDASIRAELGDIIHMFNIQIMDATHIHREDRVDFSKATIALSMIKTMKEKFIMDIPHHLTVSFSIYDKEQGGLKQHNKSFLDPINMINLLNCMYLSDVRLGEAWHLPKRFQ